VGAKDSAAGTGENRSRWSGEAGRWDGRVRYVTLSAGGLYPAGVDNTAWYGEEGRRGEAIRDDIWG
jgi:hypothetical protein